MQEPFGGAANSRVTDCKTKLHQSFREEGHSRQSSGRSGVTYTHNVVVVVVVVVGGGGGGVVVR